VGRPAVRAGRACCRSATACSGGWGSNQGLRDNRAIVAFAVLLMSTLRILGKQEQKGNKCPPFTEYPHPPACGFLAFPACVFFPRSFHTLPETVASPPADSLLNKKRAHPQAAPMLCNYWGE